MREKGTWEGNWPSKVSALVSYPCRNVSWQFDALIASNILKYFLLSNLINLTAFTNWQVSSSFYSRLLQAPTLLLITCEEAATQQRLGIANSDDEN